MATRRSPVLRVLLTVLALTLAGWSSVACGGSDPSPDTGDSHGSHGAEHEHGSHGDAEALEPPEGADWNAADAEFMTMMPVHHAQAVEMSDLAARYAQSRPVRALARSIGVTQGLEIVVYSGWLTERDLPAPEPEDAEAHLHHGMPGMLTTGQLDALAEARGAAFDRLFLQRMIAHHRGAVEMAASALADGEDVRVEELAADVIGSQEGEISRMRALLRA